MPTHQGTREPGLSRRRALGAMATTAGAGRPASRRPGAQGGSLSGGSHGAAWPHAHGRGHRAAPATEIGDPLEARGVVLDMPALDLGAVRWLLLPAESYVEFQLAAREAARDIPVCVAGYGECAPGYIPTHRHFNKGDGNLSEWRWMARGSEARMREAIGRAVG